MIKKRLSYRQICKSSNYYLFALGDQEKPFKLAKVQIVQVGITKIAIRAIKSLLQGILLSFVDVCKVHNRIYYRVEESKHVSCCRKWNSILSISHIQLAVCH